MQATHIDIELCDLMLSHMTHLVLKSSNTITLPKKLKIERVSEALFLGDQDVLKRVEVHANIML